jgi:NAD(P)-dependent dehydrogenase (short-subunit alcohol dehydrogenase family)
MHLDMASSASVQSFAKKASTELDRIDGLVANAGVMLDTWSTAEGMETSITVNVINTLFLGVLMMPKLSESGRKFGTHHTIVFVVSVLGYTVKGEMDKSREGGIFDGLNDQKRANMDQRQENNCLPTVHVICYLNIGLATLTHDQTRYALTKLVEECAIRQFADICPVEHTGVVVNMVAPGLCSTGLGRDARTFTKIMHETFEP